MIVSNGFADGPARPGDYLVGKDYPPTTGASGKTLGSSSA
ncbi:hypothetical protein BH18ACT12_BH18ACT12_08350 [soil metagenome]